MITIHNELSLAEVGIKIIEQSGEALSHVEIVKLALANGLITINDTHFYDGEVRITEFNMLAKLMDLADDHTYGKLKKVRVGDDQIKYKLREPIEYSGSILSDIQIRNERIEIELLKKLYAMDIFRFEFLIVRLLEKMGYNDIAVTRIRDDNGIEFIANFGESDHERTVIVVNRFKKANISDKHVNQLRENAENKDRGLIITLSDFTKGAIRRSKIIKKMPITLISGSELIKQCVKHQIGIKQETISVNSMDPVLFDDVIPHYVISESTDITLWNYPGGENSFVQTLNLLLDYISSSERSRNDLANWFIESFDEIASIRSVNGYLKLPQILGLIYFEESICKLTKEGKKYCLSKDTHYLYTIIADHIPEVTEIYEFIKNSPEPRSQEEIKKNLRDNGYSVDMNSQFSYWLKWLKSLNKINLQDFNFIAEGD